MTRGRPVIPPIRRKTRGGVNGDPSAVQSGMQRFQGQREYRASLQGQIRTVTFHQPMKAAGAGSAYTPSDQGVVTATPLCDFPVAFLEPPHLDVSTYLADTMTWDPDEESFPVAEACVVNWWRPEERWLFCAANVAVTARDVRNGLHIVVSMQFSGPAVATPLAGVDSFVPTNPSYEGGGPPP